MVICIFAGINKRKITTILSNYHIVSVNRSESDSKHRMRKFVVDATYDCDRVPFNWEFYFCFYRDTVNETADTRRIINCNGMPVHSRISSALQKANSHKDGHSELWLSIVSQRNDMPSKYIF